MLDPEITYMTAAIAEKSAVMHVQLAAHARHHP
jgi:hypothetical protein